MILAFDTTGPICSVALATCQGNMVSIQENPVAKGHDQLLWTLIREALKEAAITMADVTTLVAGVGPGSFTGIRIGLAAAQGLCFGRSLAAHGIRAFDNLFYAAMRDPGTPYLTLINSQTGVFYGLVYDGTPNGTPSVYTSDTILNFKGTIISDQALPFLDTSNRFYECRSTHASAGIQALLNGAPLLPLSPLYLLNPHATLSR